MTSSDTPSDLSGTSLGERKLVAVLYADMVGYSRLIGMDDAGTLARLKRLRTDVIDPAIAEHRGRIVQTGGDSLLVVFDSIDGAVRCAVKVQQQVPIHDESPSPDHTIRFRIGIDIGDAIADGTDLHGNGVIIAARLQIECPSGCICISRAVRDHAHDRLDLTFQPLGLLNLKNVARPVDAFLLRPAAVPPSVEHTLAHGAGEALPLPDKPSIAVLAFTNMSGDVEQEYFSDGIAADIITELSRIRWLNLIARNSSFAYKGNAIDVKRIGRELRVRYVMEGSVRRSGQRIRLTAQLIDAEAGNHVWAERYDRDLADVFAVQDEIALAVTKAIGPAVADAEQRRALRRPRSSRTAWEAYQQGLWHLLKYSVDHFAPARELFIRAIELDPTFASPHVELARLYVLESGGFGLRPFEEAGLLEAEQARIAVSLDPKDPHAQGMLGFALFVCQEIEPALHHVELALSISPSCSMAHHTKGIILTFTGHPREGRESVLLALQHDPLAMKLLATNICQTYYFERDYQKAADSLRRTLADNPTDPQALRWLAAALGQLGRVDEARKALSDALAKAPKAFENWTRQRPPWYRPDDHEHMLDGLRKAGWQG